ncbi:hypothetical protein HDU84_003839 [Entophlyctis sp. JEL0112]|nr:hypothetical protein HDU84_003839 [Entophlyctis sp. JEL0112]
MQIQEKYISLLEERVALSTELANTQAALRDVSDKLALSNAEAASLKSEVARLTSLLAESNLPHQRRTSFSSSASAAAASDSVATPPNAAALFSVDGSSAGVSEVRLPAKADFPASTSSVPEASNTISNLSSPSFPFKRPSNHVPSTSDDNTKRSKLSHTENDVPSVIMNEKPSPVIDAHVTKSGSGLLRVVTCNYCREEIFSNHRARWEKHALFEGPNEDGEFQKSSINSDGVNLNHVIDAHVKKTGIGAKRVITCIYCNRVVQSDYKKKWQQHVATCEDAPEDVQNLFSSSIPRPIPAAASRFADQAPDYETPGGFEHYVPPTKMHASAGVLAPFPCPPEPYLPTGERNTEGWRAWTDVIRYQRPNVGVEAKTGIAVTKFKRLHGVAEVRMYPRTSVRRTHSNMCSAIPERLFLEFLAFMDPTFMPDGFARNEGQQDISVYYSSEIPAKTKYIDIVKKIIPKYKTLPEESRKAVKRGVKKYLESVFKEDFAQTCVETTEKGATYVIPDSALEDFRNWATAELGRVFPNMVSAG